MPFGTSSPIMVACGTDRRATEVPLAVPVGEWLRLERPSVSVIIPMLNEEGYIAQCLDSILANDYPMDRLEVLVVDGMSEDGSREIVRAYAERHPNVRLLDNPRRIIPAALNIGIEESRGEIIVRMDAHAVCQPDYISQCVEILRDHTVANVGGVHTAVGETYLAEAIAIAASTPFGCGDAYYRWSTREMWVDSVVHGAWRKETLKSAGGFDESWPVNEDYELNCRIREKGGRVLLTPRLRSRYYVRRSVAAFVRQYFWYGFWKVKTLRAHPSSLRWRQVVPPLFAAAFLASLLYMPFNLRVGLALPAAYGVVLVLMSAVSAAMRSWQAFPALLITYPALHLAWGIGFWAGVFKFGVPGIPRRRSKAAAPAS